MQACRLIHGSLVIALTLSIFGPDRGATAAPAEGEPGVFRNLHGDGETTVVGSLIRAEPGKLVVQAGAAGEVSLATAPGTSYELTAPGALDLVKKGAVVWLHARLDWDNFYQLQNPVITLHLDRPSKESKIQLVMRGEGGAT